MATTIPGRIRQRRRVAELSNDHRTGAQSRREVRDLKRQWLIGHWRGLIPAAVFFAAASAVMHWFMWKPAAPYVIGSVVTSGVWFTYVNMLETGGVAPRRSGITAEEQTSLVLRRFRRHGWFLVNHVMRQRFNIDHALLGPAGFFAVETKYRSDWSKRPDLGAMGIQAREEAWALDGPLGNPATRVRPLVVLWGPDVEQYIDRPMDADGVTFCPGHLLYDYLQSLPTKICADDIETAYAELDAYILRRDQDEIDKSGELPRTVTDACVDFILIGAALLGSALVILSSANVGHGGLGAVVVSSAMAGAALLARRLWKGSVRVNRVTTAVVTMAAALATLIAVGAVLS